MIVTLTISGRRFEVDISRPFDLSIPLQFDGPQPNSYDIPPATAKAWEGDGFIGDVRRGGSCNFDEIRLVPHCNGTHTECVGHIAQERISILHTLRESFIPVTLISVIPESGAESGDSYSPAIESDNQVISRRLLLEALRGADKPFLDGLVVRTLPNDDSKLSRRYLADPLPFFTREAVEYIRKRMVRHLLVDFPSLDRTFDDGLLTAHHLFWDVPLGSHDVNPDLHSLNTVTEFIFAPNDLPDGRYLLNLQIAPFVLDAAPSRPLLFPVKELPSGVVSDARGEEWCQMSSSDTAEPSREGT